MGFAGARAAIVEVNVIEGVGARAGSEGSEDRVSDVESEVVGGCEGLRGGLEAGLHGKVKGVD